MDDIFENLGIILLIVISVAAQIIKVAKKASKNDGTPSVKTDTAHADTIGRKPLVDTTTSSPQPFLFEDLFAAATTKTKKQKKAKASLHKPAQSAEHTSQTEAKRVAETENAKPAVSADNFDIRQAIIYSEIMTPKFNEE